MKHLHIIAVFLIFACTGTSEADSRSKAKAILTPETLLYVALQYTPELNIHRMRGATENKVFVSKDGRMEGVYDKNGDLVTNCVNQGSFNYFNRKLEPLKHFEFDTLPWLKSGNCKTDPTDLQERLTAWVADFEIGLRQALGERHKLKIQDITASELKSSKSVMLLLPVMSSGSAPFLKLADINVEISEDSISDVLRSLVNGLQEAIEKHDAT